MIYFWSIKNSTELLNKLKAKGFQADVVSVSCFGVRVSVMFHFMFVHYTFSSVWVADWPPFGKKLPARLAICSHCILSNRNIYLFPVLVLRAGFAF